MNKEDFIVGKWYKSNEGNINLYIKYQNCAKNNSQIIYSSERIGKTKHDYLNKDPWSIGRNFTLLTDLTEIQEYLPDNHPDKIKELSKDEILAEAIRRYPVGIKINTLGGFNNYLLTEKCNNINPIKWINGIAICGYGVTLYKNGKWAEIVEEAKDDFVLPDKWCIKITEENISILNTYMHNNKQNYTQYTPLWCVQLHGNTYFYNRGVYAHSSNMITKDSIEITFEQFKKYVLKDTSQTIQKQIINSNPLVADLDNVKKALEDIKQYPLTPQEAFNKPQLLKLNVKNIHTFEPKQNKELKLLTVKLIK